MYKEFGWKNVTLKRQISSFFFSRWRPSSCVCLAPLLRSHPQVMDRVLFLLVKDLGRKVSCTIWGGSRLWRLRKIEFDRSALVYRSRLRSRYKKTGSLSIDTVIISVQTVSPLERVRIPLSHAPIRWAAWLFGFVFLCMCVLFVPLFFSSDVVSWVHLLHTAKGVRKNFLKIGALKRYNLSSDKTPSSSSSSIYI